MRMHLTSSCPAATSNTRKTKIWVNANLNQEFFPPLDCYKSEQEKPSLDISGLRRFIFHRSPLSVQFSLVAKSCPTLCDPMDCSTPGFPVHHHSWSLLKLMSIIVGDTIQPSHPLSSHSPPAFNLSQHRSLFKWVSPLHQVAKGLEFQLQHQSFQWMFRTDFL